MLYSFKQTIIVVSFKKMSSSKYFQNSNARELGELRNDLKVQNKDKARDALKRVIASMSVGKDMSSLFADVINCMQINSLDIKKLVYLYVINFAKAQPELAILAVNTFRKDSLDPNPLIRALAVRTMGFIRLEAITEYLLDPLRRCSRDQDPYVRKTAALCIAKLYSISPVQVIDQGLITVLQRDMLSDSNPMVVANAAIALYEITNATLPKLVLTRTANSFDFFCGAAPLVNGVAPQSNPASAAAETVSSLLNALNECTEWAQATLLECLALYVPASSRDARMVIERVLPRVSHGNPAVVMAAIKVIVGLLDALDNEELAKGFCKKLMGPVVALFSDQDQEIQYVALRSLAAVLVRYPWLLWSDVRVLLCKYNDPLYVKMEKLDLLILLVNEHNADPILSELKEYAAEVDVEFVRKAVKCVGRVAIKVEAAADKCVSALLEMVESKVNYVVQSAVVVMRDIFRKYPNRYEATISAFCENLESLDEPDATAAMVWIIGEYADRIDNSEAILETFIDSFLEQPSSVQLQILTASVKLFLKVKDAKQGTLVKVLEAATEFVDNPDMRDRAYIYWRLLAAKPDACSRVVFSSKPAGRSIVDDGGDMCLSDKALVDKLLGSVGSLASVYRLAPDSFLAPQESDANQASDVESDDSDDDAYRSRQETLKTVKEAMRNMERTAGAPVSDSSPTSAGGKSKPTSDEDETGSGSDESEASSDVSEGGARGSTGPEDSYDSADQTPLPIPPPLVVFSAEANAGAGGFRGLQVEGAVALVRSGERVMMLRFSNKSQQELSGFAIQFNKNPFGLAPRTSDLGAIGSIPPGGKSTFSLPLDLNSLTSGTPPGQLLMIQVAVKTNADVFYFNVPYEIHAVLRRSRKALNSKCNGLTESVDVYSTLWSKFANAAAQGTIPMSQKEPVKAKMLQAGFHFCAQQSPAALRFAAMTTNNVLCLVELAANRGASPPTATVTVHAGSQHLVAHVLNQVLALFPPGS